jgi:hypothetical protein
MGYLGRGQTTLLKSSLRANPFEYLVHGSVSKASTSHTIMIVGHWFKSASVRARWGNNVMGLNEIRLNHGQI